MRKLSSLALALLLSVSPAAAQLPLTGVGPGTIATAGGGGGFTGQGDVQTYTVWIGLRAYNAAYATALGAAVDICTAADALCTTIHVTSAGILSASDITTSTCTTTCTIKKWYDQTGNGHHYTQLTIANRAVFSTGSGCTNTALPCSTFTLSGSTSYAGTGNITQSQPLQAVWVASRTGDFTTQQNVFESASNGVQFTYAGSTNAVLNYAGSCCTNATASDSAQHVIQMLANGGSSATVVDATSTGLTAGGNGLSAEVLSLSGGSSAKFATMKFLEGGLIPANGTSNNTATCHNAFLYWGTSTSC